MGLKQNLKNLIDEKGYLSVRELEDYCRANNYKADNGTRRMRELVKAELIEKDIKNNTITGYKKKQTTIFKKVSDIKEDLDRQLTELLNIEFKRDAFSDTVREIMQVLKGNNEYNKRSLISKYA